MKIWEKAWMKAPHVWVYFGRWRLMQCSTTIRRDCGGVVEILYRGEDWTRVRVRNADCGLVETRDQDRTLLHLSGDTLVRFTTSKEI